MFSVRCTLDLSADLIQTRRPAPTPQIDRMEVDSAPLPFPAPAPVSMPRTYAPFDPLRMSHAGLSMLDDDYL